MAKTLAKPRVRYICQECGAVASQWQGRCDQCGAWNCITEEVGEHPPNIAGALQNSGAYTQITPSKLSAPSKTQAKRCITNIAELDNVLGGGFVLGSTVLIGGDPGIGKSTLLLQAAAGLGKAHKVIYISGEEAQEQICMRAMRLAVADADIDLTSATNIAAIIDLLSARPETDVVIIDSIQTMYVDGIESAPGSVTQVRTAAQALIAIARKLSIAIILVGHVTKEGAIAGPRVLEHMVDAVLYFEGDRGHQFRILRGVKNRFGATDEIGVFDMTATGLQEIVNPSALLLSMRNEQSGGSAIFAGIEGTRPLLVEIQALVTPSPLATPRRAVVGWDSNRLAMILAVLEARAKMTFSQRDVYLNVMGGLRIGEPAADFAVAAALISALIDQPLDPDCVFFGEIGLSGEIRPVSHSEQRIKEARKLGFKRAIMPCFDTPPPANKITLTQVEMIAHLTNVLWNDDG
ncbi:MAG: DNA repair protein RadA [Pseudomonadota bacterium]